MRRSPLVFLDANIPFSAALGGPSFSLLLELASTRRLRLVTSPACVREAETNLERKRPTAQPMLSEVLTLVAVQQVDEDEHAAWAAALVDPDDVHVLAAARTLAADVLLTGDTAHFGPLMERHDLGIRVTTVRTFLLAGLD